MISYKNLKEKLSREKSLGDVCNAGVGEKVEIVGDSVLARDYAGETGTVHGKMEVDFGYNGLAYAVKIPSVDNLVGLLPQDLRKI